MESNKEVIIGLYYIRDTNGIGRISSFMEYPNDLYAVTSFKKFLQTDEAKNFPILGKIELKRLCQVSQVSDMAIKDTLNITLCNAKNVDEVMKILIDKAEKDVEL